MIAQIKKQITQIILLFSILCSPWPAGVSGQGGLFSVSYAQNFAAKKTLLSIAQPESSLKVGEELYYSLEWLGIPVGKIILNMQGIEIIDGRQCYHIVAGAHPNKFFSRFYDVEYTVHTYMDKETLLSHRFEKIRRVKDKTTHVVIDFNRQKKEAQFKAEGEAGLIDISPVREEMETKKPATIKILNGVQDLFSSLYQLRLMQLKANEHNSLNIYYDQRNWQLDIITGEPFLKDMRNVGSFPVFGVTLESDLNEFILGKRRLKVYFTADSRRIPVEFRFGTGIGAIRGIIEDIPK